MKHFLFILCLFISYTLQAQFTAEMVIYRGMGDKKDVKTGDLDRDGDLDIIIASEVGIIWHTNANDPQNFSKNKVISLQPTRSIALADVDKDGDLDIVAVGFANVPTNLVWYRNDGAANFSAPIFIQSGVFQGWIYAEDIDKDNNIDLVLYNRGGSARIVWYKNNGLGNFAAPVTVASFGSDPYKGSPLAIADFDGDGTMDIATIGIYISAIVLIKNNGQGVFATPVTIANTGDPNFIFSDDIDNDGDQEIFTTDYSNNILYYKKDEAGIWQGKSIPVNAPYDLISLKIADFNTDGKKDLLVGSYDINSGSRDEVKLLKNEGNDVFAAPVKISANVGGSALAVGDFTGDTVPDAVSIYASFTFFHENDGQGNFKERINIANGGIFHHRPADLDGDGDADILLSLFLDQELVWCKNDGTGDFSLPIVIKDSMGVAYLETDDLDRDGDEDIIALNSSKIIFLYNDGQGNFSDVTLPTGGSAFPQTYSLSKPSLRLLDIEEDGDIDVLITAGFSNERVIWYKNDGQGRFAEAAFLFEFQSSRNDPIDVADLDGDSLVDLVVGETLKVKWFKNQGNGSFTEASLVINDTTIAQTTNRVMATDLDNDQDFDIIHAFRNGIVWYQNDGQGNFSSSIPLVSVSEVFYPAMQVVDLDKDNDKDIVLGGPALVKNWYENNGMEQFFPKDTFYLFRNEAIPYVADLDQDNDVDIILNSPTDKLVWYGNSIRTSTNNPIFPTIKTRVYPNPFHDQLTIAIDKMTTEPYHLQILDATGRRIHHTTMLNNPYLFQQENLPKGLYFYQLFNQQGMLVAAGKIVCQ